MTSQPSARSNRRVPLRISALAALVAASAVIVGCGNPPTTAPASPIVASQPTTTSPTPLPIVASQPTTTSPPPCRSWRPPLARRPLRIHRRPRTLPRGPRRRRHPDTQQLHPHQPTCRTREVPAAPTPTSTSTGPACTDPPQLPPHHPVPAPTALTAPTASASTAKARAPTMATSRPGCNASEPPRRPADQHTDDQAGSELRRVAEKIRGFLRSLAGQGGQTAPR
jgi:hypothetical protein